MARVTVEDCLDSLTNRFQLILLASKRARDLSRGSDEPKVDWENDKSTVVALREIAAGEVSMDYFKVDHRKRFEEAAEAVEAEMSAHEPQQQSPEQP